jgi:hypothetical protein
MQEIFSLLGNALYSYSNNKISELNQYDKLRLLQNNLQNTSDITIENKENASIPIALGKITLNGYTMWYNNLTGEIIQNDGITTQNSFNSSILKNFVDFEQYTSKLFPESKNGKLDINYKIDIAIGICEGEVDELLEVYANGTLLNLSEYKYTFYNGTENQDVDKIVGKDKNLAFRGLSYIVFEQFPISNFSSSIPKFTFTIQRNLSKNNPYSMNNLIKGVTLIPGSGEFCYHTDIITQYKVRGTQNGDVLLENSKKYINYNNNSNKADVLVALDQLQSQLPNLEWVSVIVNWFGDSIDIANCSVFPACEYNDYNMVTLPDEWRVAGKKRTQTRVIGRDSNGKLRYGGTPSDGSVVALLSELKARGLKVAFTPMLMMDCNQKPWRGRLTGSHANISNFFHKSDGYNAFVKHYANLTKGLADCFVIGTEMIGLTKINHNNAFPAVDEFCSLAGEIRAIVGNSTKLTYAADWSEYHHTEGGFYNMDKLWANGNIDFIGLDAYFPLTEKYSQPLISEIENGWNSGEGWDFYYNFERTQKFPLSPEWAWKNIRWFIENEHINSDGVRTAWQPKMKKVWFMEYGFPSVDLSTNQPNVFHDESSSESAFPRGSKGMVDFQSQSDAIIATENFWAKNSDIVQNKFIWTWDARPFPFFPLKTEVWADCSNWQFGHWLNGKVMSCQVSDLVEFLLLRSGIENYEIRNVNGVMNGVYLSGMSSYKTLLMWTMLLYNLRMFSENGKIIVNSISNLDIVELNNGDILIDEVNAEILNINQVSGIGIAKLSLSFLDIENKCNKNVVYIKDDLKPFGLEYSLSVPFVLSYESAEMLARKAMNLLNLTKMQKIYLPAMEKYLKIHTGNLIKLEDNTMGLVESVFYDGNNVVVEFTKIHKSLLGVNDKIIVVDGSLQDVEMVKSNNFLYQILDINNFTNRGHIDGIFPLWFAFYGIKNISVYYSTEKNGNYIKIFDENVNSVIGKVLYETNNEVENELIDEVNTITVEIIGDVDSYMLKSISDDDFYSMKNLCVIGNEICAFKNVVNLGNGLYQISHLLRGRFGTNIEKWTNGKRFVLISGFLHKFEFPFDVARLYFKFAYNGKSMFEVEPVEFIPQKFGIKFWNVKNIQKILKDNGDILFTWNEQIAVRNNFFGNSWTNLRVFRLKISTREEPIEVVGLNYFLYTKDMQNIDKVMNFEYVVCDVEILA